MRPQALLARVARRRLSLSNSSVRQSDIMSEAASGDLRVHRQRAEQRDQDEDDRCNRSYSACGQQRDAWLISERREVVHAREPDHLSPRMGANCRSLVILQRLAPCQPPSDGGLVLERLFLFHLLAKRNARRNLP